MHKFSDLAQYVESTFEYLRAEEPDYVALRSVIDELAARIDRHPNLQSLKAKRPVRENEELWPDLGPTNLARWLAHRAHGAGVKSAFADLERLIETSRFELTFCLTLTGFKNVTPTIELTNGITLVPAQQLPSGITIDDTPVGAGLIKSVVLDGPLSQPSLRAPRKSTLEELRHCAYALSLADPYYIAPTPVIGSVSSSESYLAGLFGGSYGEIYLDEDEQTLLGTKYTLPLELADEVRQVLGRFLSLPVEARRKYETGLQRFADAKRRGTRSMSSLYNCALDLGIALESLLLPEKSHTDTNYRVQLRTAKLLSRDIDERVKISKQVSKLYAKRSDAAHGVSASSTPENLNKLRTEMGAYKRLAQRAIISLISAEASGTVQVGDDELWKRFDLS